MVGVKYSSSKTVFNFMAKLENVAKQVSLFTETDVNITSALFFY